MVRAAVLAVAISATAGACFYDTTSPLPADFGVCPATPPAPPPATTPTYWRDVKPIVDTRCATCHVDGGVAPFPLTSFPEVVRRAASARHAVETRAMPPWQPDPCCSHYRDDRSLTDAQIATFLAWVDAGTPEGDPADAPPTPPPAPEGLPRVDVRVAMSAPFSPSPKVGRDELRCFLLDHRFAADAFVTGVNVIPGNRRAVHHVVLYAVPGDRVGALRARDGADGRPGWDCYGALDELDAQRAIGGWQPGEGPDVLVEGMGREVTAGAQLVLNVHYDTGAGGTSPDVTTVELMLADRVERIERGAAIGNPLWFAGDGMRIEAGDPDAWVFFSFDPTVLFNRGRGFDIHKVMLHMHELGSIGRLAILRANGAIDCLLNITDWDFHWLGSYYLDPPVRLDPGDRLYVECHWDNTAGNQKLVDGERQAPRTIGWGADEEMCGGVISFSVEAE